MTDARDGAARIAAERKRQRDAEGYTDDHDDEHDDGSLAEAAGCYAFAAASTRVYRQERSAASVQFADPWPWEQSADARPYNGNVLRDATDDEAIRLLEKAGALIAAEIDRLLRAKKTSPGEKEGR